jgi:hypothetical protein
MNLKLITEKFKDHLTPEDLVAVHDEFTKMVNEAVQTRLEVEKDELSILAEKYAEEKTKKAVKKAKKKMEEDFKVKYEALEESIITKLDRFLDNEISSKISDDVLKTVAINETFAPIIDGIKVLFEDRYVKLDSKGHGLVKELRSKLDEKAKEVNSLVTEKMQLANLLEQTSIKGLIAEKSKVLTEPQAKKLVKMCEGKAFDELHDKIDTFVEIINESAVSSKKILKESKKEVTGLVSDEELVTESKKTSSRDTEINESVFVRNAEHLI